MILHNGICFDCTPVIKNFPRESGIIFHSSSPLPFRCSSAQNQWWETRMGDLNGGVLVPIEHQWMLLCAYTKRIGRYIARNTGLNIGLRLANERRDYFVTTSLIRWHNLRNSLAVYIRVKWCIRYRVQYVVLFFIPFYSHGKFCSVIVVDHIACSHELCGIHIDTEYRSAVVFVDGRDLYCRVIRLHDVLLSNWQMLK